MQFDAQHAHYQEHYAGAAFDVILVDGQPAGRLYVAREADEIRIVDIALLPEFCNRGIGTTLLRGCKQRRRPPASRCASTSSASIPRCGSTSGSGSGRSTTRGYTCSWSGQGGRETPVNSQPPNFQLPGETALRRSR